MLTGTTLGNVTTSQSYSSHGELSSYTANYSGTPIFQTTYSRDSLGRITTLNETDGSTSSPYQFGVAKTLNYSYDAVGRLAKVWRDDTLVSTYSYDANGNRIAHITPTSIDSGAYDAQDRMLSYAGAQYIYGLNGDLQSKISSTDTTKYTYDALGNLTQVIMPPKGQANGDVIQYVVDGQNRRIAKKVNGIIAQRFLYAGNLIPIAELDSAGNIMARFVGMYIVKGGNTYRLVADHLGSIRMVVDVATGEVVQRIDYDEYGNELTNTNPDFQPFGFAGGVYDSQTKLERFGTRDYDASTGRWTAKDPIGFGGGDPDLYSYALENPVSFVDKDGLSCLVFNRLTNTLRLYDWMGNLVAAFNAANNVTNPKGDPCKLHSNGPAPNGLFAVSPPRRPYNAKMETEQGSYVFRLGTPGDIAWQRTLELHAGRESYKHVTQGCIRVDESTIEYLYNYYQLDPIRTITIEDQYRFIGGMELWENCY